MRDSFYMNQSARNKSNECKPESNSGVLLRVFIPAGAVINLANLLEVSSPSGICLIVRVPLLGGNNLSVDDVMHTIRSAGGTAEIVHG